MRRGLIFVFSAALACSLVAGMFDPAYAKKKDKKKEDPFAEFVWPPPPDEPRIKLEAVVRGRADVEAKSGFKRKLMSMSPAAEYENLVKPFGAAIDPEGRVLVTDTGSAAVMRFDFENRRMDVIGTRGSVRLKAPMGIEVGPDGTIYVADTGLAKVAAFDPEGKLRGVYGHEGELVNPTGVALSRDGKTLFVADSRAHKIVVYDIESGDLERSFGGSGGGEGEFAFPTSLAVDTDGNLLVVDQMNARVQVVAADGEYIGQFGALGVGFANFVRPKDVAVDEVGFIYVTDNAFNNVQIFDADFSLLTFFGEGGLGPGRFHGASGIAVQGDKIAVVDQLGKRVQIFRFLVPKDR